MRGCVKSGLEVGLRVSGAGGLLFAGLWLSAHAAAAEPDTPRTEFFTGFELTDNYASGYVGAGYALGQAGRDAPGFRLRAVGAYGGYHYDGSVPFNGVGVPATFDGQDTFSAALIGYEFRPRYLILKLFAGIEAEDQHIVPHDPNNSVQGSALGLRLQTESWTDLSEKTFLSVDAAYGTAFQEYWSLARLGYRLTPRFALGLEGGALGNEEYDAGRGGGFARVTFREMEVTLSSGYTGNYLEDDPSVYFALGLYRPF